MKSNKEGKAQLQEKGAQGTDRAVSPPSRLLKFDQLETWQQDNSDIHNFYRPKMSFAAAFGSVFAIGGLHNEFFNIWSHSIAAFWFGNLEWQHSSESSLDQRYVLSMYRISAFVCFFMSSSFHTFQCVSENASVFLSRLDYSGILGVLCGGGSAWIALRFKEMIFIRSAYLLVGLVMASYLLYQIWSTKFFTAENRTTRAMAFCFFALLIFVPFSHCIWLKGCVLCFDDLGPVLFAILGGTLVYVTRFPESYWPGQFDLVSSHF